MTRDDIISMVEEASGGRQPDGWGVMLDHEQLERFANLVAAAERKVCQDNIDALYKMYIQASQQRDELMEQHRVQRGRNDTSKN